MGDLCEEQRDLNQIRSLSLSAKMKSGIYELIVQSNFWTGSTSSNEQGSLSVTKDFRYFLTQSVWECI